jgi:hypothetical protein
LEGREKAVQYFGLNPDARVGHIECNQVLTILNGTTRTQLDLTVFGELDCVAQRG